MPVCMLAGGDVRGVSEMDAYSIISGLTARALPAELQATGYKEIARCCNSAVKGTCKRNRIVTSFHGLM